MNDLDVMKRAKMYLDQLSQGIDPITGSSLSREDPLGGERLKKCFAYTAGVLERVIRNGGVVSGGHSGPAPFALTPEEKAAVVLFPEPVNISTLVRSLNEASGAVTEGRMKKLSYQPLLRWLLAQGYLKDQEGAAGKKNRLITALGAQLGLRREERTNQQGITYSIILYSHAAQQLMLDRLEEILAED